MFHESQENRLGSPVQRLVPISTSFVGSSDTVSSLDRKLLMALKAWQTERRGRKENTTEALSTDNK